MDERFGRSHGAGSLFACCMLAMLTTACVTREAAASLFGESRAWAFVSDAESGLSSVHVGEAAAVLIAIPVFAVTLSLDVVLAPYQILAEMPPYRRYYFERPRSVTVENRERIDAGENETGAGKTDA